MLPVNRTRWVMDSLEAYRPLVERLAEALGPQEVPDADEADDDPIGGMFSGMLQMFQPMVLAMTAGSMVGHLAQRTFGQYDLPIPRPLTGPAADELLLVVPNLDAFADEWSLAPDDLRLWICVHEVATHAVLGVPHVRARLDDLLTRYVSSFRNDPSALEDRIGEIDLADPAALANLQEAHRLARGHPRRHHLAGAGRAAPGARGDRRRRRRRRRPRRRRRRAASSSPATRMLTEALRRRRVEAGRGRPLRGAPLRARAHPGHLRPGQRLRRTACSSGRATTACAASGRATSSSPPPPRSTPPASGSPASTSRPRRRSPAASSSERPVRLGALSPGRRPAEPVTSRARGSWSARPPLPRGRVCRSAVDRSGRGR